MTKQRAEDLSLAHGVIRLIEKEKKMKIVIDRIEKNLVVAELPNGDQKVCPIEIFPEGIKEGDIVSIEIAAGETENKRSEMKSKMNELFKRSKRGE